MNKRVLSLFLGLASVAIPKTWTVTTVQDVVDPNDGVTSLREAIIAANANVNPTGRCQGISNINFSLSGTNAMATYGTTAVPYYKLKINYLDPDYAKLMGLSTPVPTPLPHVRCPINLDGYSQPGSQPGSPMIEISGEDLSVDFAPTPDSVAGEDMERTPDLLMLVGRLVRQPTEGKTLVGCQPEDHGCPLRRSASGSTIRGIMFNHAPTTGLHLLGADQVTVIGNYFGLDATGENPAPNGRKIQEFGLLYSLLINGASNNTIGKPGERNYFGAARSHGIILWPFTNGDPCGQTASAGAVCSRFDIGSSDNVIQANYFGLNKEGTRSVGGVCILQALTNDRPLVGETGCSKGRTLTDAIYSSGGPQIFVLFFPGGFPVSSNPMLRNRIGGVGPGEGNVITGGFGGVSVKAVDTQVVGNIFGLAADGIGAAEIAPFFRQPLAILSDSPGTVVEQNVIANSANFSDVTTTPIQYVNAGGILIAGGRTGDGFSDDLPPNHIWQNYIGTNIHGEHPGQNLVGLPATNAAAGVALQWMLPTEIASNLIAYNGYLGVAHIAARAVISGGTYFPPRHLVVQSNFMYCNGAIKQGETCGRGLGIDWRASNTNPTPPGIGDGPTLNDDGDLDDGPAELQNFPTLQPAQGRVTGLLNSTPNTHFRVELFMSDPASATCVDITTTIQPGFTSDPTCGSFQFLAIQGEIPVAQLEVVTGSDGNASFSATIPGGGVVAATATRLDHGQPVATSELSQAVRVER